MSFICGARIFFAEEFRGPADHQPGDEHGQQREHQDGVEPARRHRPV